MQYTIIRTEQYDKAIFELNKGLKVTHTGVIIKSDILKAFYNDVLKHRKPNKVFSSYRIESDVIKECFFLSDDEITRFNGVLSNWLLVNNKIDSDVYRGLYSVGCNNLEKTLLVYNYVDELGFLGFTKWEKMHHTGGGIK